MPESSLMLLLSQSQPPPCLTPSHKAATYLIFFTTDFCFFWMSCKCNHTVCTLLWMVFMTQQNVLGIKLCCFSLVFHLKVWTIISDDYLYMRYNVVGIPSLFLKWIYSELPLITPWLPWGAIHRRKMILMFFPLL